MPKNKIHTVYKTADDTRVPSVTTILGILSKPALIQWAWELGTQGLDYRKVRDQAGDIGTLAHYLIMCHLRGEAPDTSEYSPQNIDRAESSLIKYWDWEKANSIIPMLIEVPLVSERYRFGGTIDLLGELNGDLWLIDYKTGKAIYPEMLSQIAAYRVLLGENGYPVKGCRILRISKDDTEDFEDRIVGSLERYWAIFEHCLAIYQLQKEK